MNKTIALPATLRLEQIRLYAYHGVLPQETRVGAWYTLDLTLQLTLDEATLLHDNLEGTINYAEVLSVVKQTMASPSKLIERAAFVTATAVLQRFERIEAVTITLRKDTPPMGGNLQGASITLTCSRQDCPDC